MARDAASRLDRPRVVYWNNVPAPYMVDRFNALVLRNNLDFHAWFSRRTHPDRSWRVDERDWTFPYRYLPRAAIGGHGLALATPLIRERPADLLVSLYGAPEYVLGLALASRLKLRTAIWSEVTFDSWVRRRFYKEWLKRRIFSDVDAVLTAGDDGRRFARRYGADDGRVHVVRHVIDGPYFAARTAHEAVAAGELRADLGLTGTVFAFVGRLCRPKGVFDLLDAFVRIRGRGIDAQLLLVGDGVDESQLRALARDVAPRGVHFAGFQSYESLPIWYAASDVLVFPTLGDPYGLVVDEAMACGLPVISTTAAGEISWRVRPWETGLLVPPGRPDELADAMVRLAQDRDSRERMGLNAAALMSTAGPDRWAREFEEAVFAILGAGRRG